MGSHAATVRRRLDTSALIRTMAESVVLIAAPDSKEKNKRKMRRDRLCEQAPLMPLISIHIAAICHRKDTDDDVTEVAEALTSGASQ